MLGRRVGMFDNILLDIELLLLTISEEAAVDEGVSLISESSLKQQKEEQSYLKCKNIIIICIGGASGVLCLSPSQLKFTCIYFEHTFHVIFY